MIKKISTFLISALFVLTVLYWLYFIPLFDKHENDGKKGTRQAGRVTGKNQISWAYIWQLFWESKYVGWSNEALVLEATEFLKRSAPLGREAIRGWINARFKLREQAQREVHYFFRNTDKNLVLNLMCLKYRVKWF